MSNTELIIIYGREFFILLCKLEAHLNSQIISLDKTKMRDEVANWKRIVAFMTRKLSAYLKGETDFDFDIKDPRFILIHQPESEKEVQNE